MLMESDKIAYQNNELIDFFNQYNCDAFKKVAKFAELLAKEGELRGLIGPRELPKLWDRHIVNSSSLATVLPKDKKFSIVDVGSGAGFPGVVIACMFQNADVYLVESMQRRVQWLEYVKDIIGLDNINVIHSRAEDAIKDNKVPKCDFVTARAVAALNKLIPWTLPFLKNGGHFYALKGEKVYDESNDAQNILQKFRIKRPSGGNMIEVLDVKACDNCESTKLAHIQML